MSQKGEGLTYVVKPLFCLWLHILFPTAAVFHKLLAGKRAPYIQRYDLFFKKGVATVPISVFAEKSKYVVITQGYVLAEIFYCWF